MQDFSKVKRNVMTRIRTAAVLVVGLAALVGCTSPSNPSPSVDSRRDEQTVSTIKWEGDAQSPKLVISTPLRVSQPTVRSIEPGTGASISLGQLVTFDTLVVDGETGQTEASSFGGTAPSQLILSKATANVTMLAAMQSAKVGGKFLYVVPTSDSTAAASPSTGGATPADNTAPSKVIAISIRSVESLPTEAHGQPKTPNATLPKVTFGADGTASVAPKGAQPSTLSSGLLIEGTGAKVTEGQTVAVKYYGWLWNGKVFDSVWGDTAPEVLNLNEVISGWRKAIVGQKVGSRVVIVVPPAMGYGGSGNDVIPPDSTLVFLVDVLGAY